MKLATIVVAAAVFGLGLAACDHVASTRIVNTGRSPLFLVSEVNSPRRVLIPAGGEISIGELPGEGLTLTIEHEDGRLVYSERLSWEDLQSRDFRVVFNEHGLAPTQ